MTINLDQTQRTTRRRHRPAKSLLALLATVEAGAKVIVVELAKLAVDAEVVVEGLSVVADVADVAEFAKVGLTVVAAVAEVAMVAEVAVVVDPLAGVTATESK